MQVDHRVVARLEHLVAEGESLLQLTKTWNNSRSTAAAAAGDLAEWHTKCLSLITRVFGHGSVHRISFAEHAGKKGLPLVGGGFNVAAMVDAAHQALGVLKAALSDYEGGYLFDVRQLVHAEVLDDLLEQAQALHGAGYHAPAAVVAGCVLEDSLRTMCIAEPSIVLPARPKLDGMNAQLAKAGVYTKLVQKRITAEADLRNSAAHGHWDKVEREDVGEMITWVRRFIERHMS